MSIIRNTLTALALSAALVGAPAFAQTTTTGTTPAVAFVAKQAAGEASHSSLVGLAVKNPGGETIGDVNYLVLDPAGKVSTIVIGVGGFLGVGEKNVGVPYSAVTLSTDADGKKIASLDTTKDALKSAPAYEWTEKTTAQYMKEKASDMASKAKKTAQDLANQAAEKAKEMTSDKPKVQ